MNIIVVCYCVIISCKQTLTVPTNEKFATGGKPALLCVLGGHISE